MSTSSHVVEQDEPDDFESFIETCAQEFGWEPNTPEPPLPQSFTIFNDRYSSDQSGKRPDVRESFSAFNELPRELRLEIWTINLRRHRFLDVVLSNSATDTVGHEQAYEDELAGEDPQHSTKKTPAKYQASFRSRLASLSPLFSVCQESASAARNFYSIQLPCYATAANHVVSMPLSPEWDILNISTNNMTNASGVLAEFFHDLRTTDLYGRGSSNLCLGHQEMKALSDIDVNRLSPPVRQSYQGSLTALRRLYWRCTPRADLARICGSLLRTRTLTWYSTTLPLFPGLDLAAGAMDIDFVGADSRPISPDLQDVWFGQDPRLFLPLWAQIQRNLGLDESNRRCECRVLLAAEPRGDEAVRYLADVERSHAVPSHAMSGRASVDAYLSTEVAEFRKTVGAEESDRCPGSSGGLGQSEWQLALRDRASLGVHLPASAEEFVKLRLPETAVGFWLFDPADLDRLPPARGSLTGKTLLRLGELRDVRPELCVFNLQRT